MSKWVDDFRIREERPRRGCKEETEKEMYYCKNEKITAECNWYKMSEMMRGCQNKNTMYYLYCIAEVKCGKDKTVKQKCKMG